MKEENSDLSNRENGGDTVTKNAASRAGDHGVISDKKAQCFQSESYHNREALQRNLFAAIGECDRSDAAQIMAAALDELVAGYPIPTFLNAQKDAEFWASIASPQELEAYCIATCRKIGNRAWGMAARKQLFIMLWESFGEDDKRSFIRRIDPRGRFTGRAA